MMYQRNQQANRDNYNNDENYDSSESDSDSDAEMEENQGDGENALEDALMPADNNENNLPNNEIEEDDARGHNGILERIDYLGRNDDLLGPARDDDANIQDDSRPVPFDDNSRGNFDLQLLGEGSGCGDLNLDIPPPTVNDDSSRESMDMDDENGRPTLGNIIVERDPDKIDELERKERRNSDEEPLNNFFGNDEYCSYMRNGTEGAADDMNNCKCSKCCVMAPAKESCNNCTDSDCCDKLRACFKRRSLDDTDGTARGGSTSVAGPSSSTSSSLCRKDCSSDDDDDIETKSKRPKTGHCDSNSINISNRNELADGNGASTDENSKETDDSNCDCANETEMDTEERDAAEDTVAVTPKECTCFENKLDHVNGHSSKMCLELPKTPCEKCTNKDSSRIATEGPSNDDAATAAEKCEGNDKFEDKAGPSNDRNAIAGNVNNLRNRDNNVEPENARPSKRAKLNNGSAANRAKVPRTIFHKALDAVGMSWDNQHLQNILASSKYSIDSPNSVQTAGSSKSSSTVIVSALKSNFNSLGQPLWHEPLAMCAARVDSLRSHGHTDAALRLSISVVRTMKQIQKDGQLLWNRYQSITNVQMHNDRASSNSCCCDCNGGNGQNSYPNTSSSGGSGRNKRPLEQSNRGNAGYASGGYMGGSSTNKDAYKMYRYDYGGHNASYRYSGMGHDGCKRCLEARERAGYAHAFHPNRMNIGGSGLPPPFFRSSFGPMGGNNMYDQRFGSGHFGGPVGYAGRYGNGNNSGYPPNMSHSNACHAENCSLGHRPHNGMVGESFGNLFSMSRPHCSKDLDKYMSGQNGFHNNANGHHCNPDGRMREICGPSHNTRSNQHNCKGTPEASGSQNCESSRNEAGTSSGSAREGSSSDKTANENLPGCSKDVAKPSSSAEPSAKRPCTQHTKNQCCIKNYCCKVSSASEKPKCCTGPSCSMGTSNGNYGANSSKPYPAQSASSSSNNIYFGRNRGGPSGAFDLLSSSHSCHQRSSEESSYACCRPSTSSSSSSSSNPTNSIVNYGASTSKAASSTVNPTTEFVRNKKPGCASNCLDCSVGCDVEFPLDAVACIFDCLTEACIIPDSINGPDMGRLSFDSVTGAGDDGSIIPPRYQHVPVPISNDRNETYLTLAIEAAVLALGKQRIMPHGLYSQHVICKQQDQLIARLRHVDLDRLLIEVLKQLTTQLLDGGPSSGLGKLFGWKVVQNETRVSNVYF